MRNLFAQPDGGSIARVAIHPDPHPAIVGRGTDGCHDGCTYPAKLERKVFEPHWLREVVEDGDARFLIESGEQIAYVNRAYALLLGYGSPEQLRGQHLSIVVADEDSPRLLAYSRLRVRDEAAPRQYDLA